MLLSLFAALALSAAKPTTDPCRDDAGNNRCLPAEQEKMRKLYRVEPINAFVAGTSRRLFYVDGYGRDVIAIHFLQMPGRDPMLTVHFPKPPGEEAVAPLQTLLAAEQWQTVIDASEHFDRKFASTQPIKGSDEEDAISICLHSWAYWAEATDPGTKSRSVTDDACNDSPVELYAWAVVKLARSLFPQCAMLDPQYSRNDATLLKTCQGLSGDRIAAAEVWNRGKSFRSIDSAETYGGIDDFSDYDVTLDYNGSVTKGKAAYAMWKSIFAEKRRPNFYYGSIKGIDEKTVIVSGELYLAGDDDMGQTADVVMRWKKDGNVFSIETIKIGPYKPYKRVSE